MSKNFPDKIANELMTNMATKGFYQKMIKDDYFDYKNKIMNLYDLVKVKFNEEDQLTFLTYIFEKANYIPFYHYKDLCYFIDETEKYLNQIRPKDSSFYYVYALTYQKYYREQIISSLNAIYARVGILMQEACENPFPFMMKQEKLEKDIENRFSYFRDPIFIDNNIEVKRLINAAIDDAIRYVFKCIERSKKDETYCDECNLVYCNKEFKKKH